MQDAAQVVQSYVKPQASSESLDQDPERPDGWTDSMTANALAFLGYVDPMHVDHTVELLQAEHHETKSMVKVKEYVEKLKRGLESHRVGLIGTGTQGDMQSAQSDSGPSVLTIGRFPDARRRGS